MPVELRPDRSSSHWAKGQFQNALSDNSPGSSTLSHQERFERDWFWNGDAAAVEFDEGAGNVGISASGRPYKTALQWGP